MARKIAHLTPRYIKNRLLVIYDEYHNPKSPWLTAESVRLLDQLIKPTDVGVEFGSGRSTICSYVAWRGSHQLSMMRNGLKKSGC